jgi:hypothetical protein
MPTSRQRLFSRLVGSGCSPVDAARRAGYKHPAQAAHSLLSRHRKIECLVVDRAIEGGQLGSNLMGAISSGKSGQRRRLFMLMLSRTTGGEG